MKSKPVVRIWRFAVLYALAGALGLSACAPLLSAGGGAGEYRVLDSGLVGRPDDKPVWLNDDEILYSAQTDEQRFHKNANVTYRALRVTIWNTRTGHVTRLQELTGALCYRDGYIASWWQDQSDPDRSKGTETFGRLGESLRTVEARPGGMQYDPATCRPKSESPSEKPLPEWTQGKKVNALPEIEGILVLDAEQEKSVRNRPVTFHPRGEASGVAMPFNSREHHVQGYHPFKGAYFVLGSYFVKVPGHPNGGYGKSPWPKDMARPYWWIYADGRALAGVVKPSREHYDTSVLPFRNGIAWHIGFVRGEGLYTTDASGERQVVLGFVQQAATSPDGCRIAMNHRKSINDSWTAGTLKVIELCEGAKQ